MSPVLVNPYRFGTTPPPTDAYDTVCAADSPVAVWRLGELSGTSAADQTGSFPGTYAGSPTLGVTGIPGSADTAVTFGSGKYVDLGAVLNLSGVTEFTIELWMKTSTWGSDSFAPLISKSDLSWRLARNSTGQGVQFGITTGSTGSVSSNTVNCADNNWHHIVAVQDNTQAEGFVHGLFIGGTLVASNANTLTPQSTGNSVRIASNSTQTARVYPGTLDEVRIYMSALSSARILAHYNAGITP